MLRSLLQGSQLWFVFAELVERLRKRQAIFKKARQPQFGMADMDYLAEKLEEGLLTKPATMGPPYVTPPPYGPPAWLPILDLLRIRKPDEKYESVDLMAARSGRPLGASRIARSRHPGL